MSARQPRYRWDAPDTSREWRSMRKVTMDDLARDARKGESVQIHVDDVVTTYRFVGRMPFNRTGWQAVGVSIGKPGAHT